MECDVRLTADDHLVCVHDRRVNRTSNGRGVVSTLELATLEGLDWGTWMAGHDDAEPELPDRDAGRLLTLPRLLDAVRDCGRPVGVAIETKHPTRYAGQVERRLAQVLESYGWAARARRGTPPPVRMMSFSPLALRRISQLAPEVPRVLLVRDRIPLRLRDGVLPPGVGVVGVNVRLLRRHRRYAAQVRQRGHRLHVWTVDQATDVELCLQVRADAIITNRPRHVLELLGRGQGTASRS